MGPIAKKIMTNTIYYQEVTNSLFIHTNRNTAQAEEYEFVQRVQFSASFDPLFSFQD